MRRLIIHGNSEIEKFVLQFKVVPSRAECAALQQGFSENELCAIFAYERAKLDFQDDEFRRNEERKGRM